MSNPSSSCWAPTSHGGSEMLFHTTEFIPLKINMSGRKKSLQLLVESGLNEAHVSPIKL